MQVSILKWHETSGSCIEIIDFEKESDIKMHLQELNLNSEDIHTAEYGNDGITVVVTQ